MQIDPRTLEGVPRDQLIERARKAGVRRPELLTRVELKDEIVRLSETDERKRRAARGWLGVARDLLASMIEQGLHMPDAAKLIRGEPLLGDLYTTQTPVATVTLAEIYVAQGHSQRALKILDEVLAREPEHEAARELRDRLTAEVERAAPSGPAVAPPPEVAPEELEPAAEDEPVAEAEPAAGERAEPAAGGEPAGPVVRGVMQESSARPAMAPVLPSSVSTIPAPPAQTESRVLLAADVVVTIAEAPGRVYLYWEVSDRSLGRARKQHADGRAVIRLLEVRPSWDGAQKTERELDIELPSGSRRVPADDKALVRAALGWRSAAGFMPFAVGSELSPPGGNGREPSLSPPELRALERYRTARR